VVRAQVAAPDVTYWEFSRQYLADPSRRQMVKDLRPKSIASRVSMLRVLDVTIWMTGSNGKEAKRVRSTTSQTSDSLWEYQPKEPGLTLSIGRRWPTSHPTKQIERRMRHLD